MNIFRLLEMLERMLVLFQIHIHLDNVDYLLFIALPWITEIGNGELQLVMKRSNKNNVYALSNIPRLLRQLSESGLFWGLSLVYNS